MLNSTDLRFERILEKTVKFFVLQIRLKNTWPYFLPCLGDIPKDTHSTCTFLLGKPVSIKHFVHQFGLEKGQRLWQASAQIQSGVRGRK